MSTRTALRGLACAALAAAVAFVAAAPAAADRDPYGNSLFFSPTACNPAEALLSVAVLQPTVAPVPVFLNGVAWVDYYGVPVAVLPAFRVRSDVIIRGWGFKWPWPNPSALPPGRYTVHTLLQGNPTLGGLLGLVFTTVSATATVDPASGPGCTPTAAAAAEPSPRVLVRRVRRAASRWGRASLGPRAAYPKARICGSSVCVKRSAGAAWAPLPGR